MRIRYIIPISGKDSLATAIVQTAAEPGLPYEYVFNDTAMELPETYAWLEKVERVMGYSILRMGKSLEDIIKEQKCLPSMRMRYCTKYAKIFPMRDYIGRDKAVVYMGIRSDEDRVSAQETRNLDVRYPLKEMGVNLALVYRIVGDRGLMPPDFFWKRVHAAVVAELGSLAVLLDELPQWIFQRTFAWRTRPNCFMCFFQRLYEWAGLLEHHPLLFGRAEELELEHGYSENTREHPYYWLGEGMPLSRVRERFEEIVASRVSRIVKLIRKRAQGELFVDALVDGLEASQTSCGLYCGK